MNHDGPADQHSIVQSLLLHLAPGVLVGFAYFALAPTLRGWGYPSIAALMVAAALVLVPLELGFLLYQGRKRSGRWSLRGVIAYRTRLPVWQYLLWVPVLFLIVGAVFTLLRPVDSLLRETLFAGMPALESGLTAEYTRGALITTYALVAVVGAVVAPTVEELYFRGYLLPRMRYAGRGAPVLHSLLFALYHVWTPWQFVTRTVGMLPLVYAAQRRSLYLAIVLHVLLNTLDVIAGLAFIATMELQGP